MDSDSALLQDMGAGMAMDLDSGVHITDDSFDYMFHHMMAEEKREIYKILVFEKKYVDYIME